MKAIRNSVLLVFCVGLVPVAFAQADQQEEKPENLQVLSENMSIQQVRRVMFQFNNALGVRCIYCHVGEEGKPPSTYDFASDDKETKETARAMMRMVQVINDDHIYELPDGDESIAVNCQTCHHGLPKPQLLEDVLTDHFAEHGVEETLTEYETLKEKHFGGFAYNFQEGTLNRLAQRLLSQSELEAAQAFLTLNLSMYPNSSDAYALQAETEIASGDNEAAIKSLEKAIELNPRNRRVRERLTGLKGEN